MPNPGEDYRGAKACWVSGWGYVNKYSRKSPNVLQKLAGNVLLGPDLESQNPFSCSEGQIGFGHYRRSTCNGDSGGPLVCPSKTKPGRYDVVGIVSYGITSDCLRKPKVFTEVAHYIDWIKKNMV